MADSVADLEHAQVGREYFKEFDKDCSGTLDRAEFGILHTDLVKAGYQLESVDKSFAGLEEYADHGVVKIENFVPWFVLLQQDDEEDDDEEEELPEGLAAARQSFERRQSYGGINDGALKRGASAAADSQVDGDWKWKQKEGPQRRLSRTPSRGPPPQEEGADNDLIEKLRRRQSILMGSASPDEPLSPDDTPDRGSPPRAVYTARDQKNAPEGGLRAGLERLRDSKVVGESVSDVTAATPEWSEKARRASREVYRDTWLGTYVDTCVDMCIDISTSMCIGPGVTVVIFYVYK